LARAPLVPPCSAASYHIHASMFKRWFGKELTDEEKRQFVTIVRNKFEKEDLSEATARRFAAAREWDEAATVTMLEEHFKWRKATLPIERTPAIEKVLASGRVRILRRGKEPIIAVDFMWGQFLLDDFNEDDIIAAQCFVNEDVLAEADALCPEDQPATYIALSTGGPPPTPFVKKVSPIFDINYPERCDKAIIYPIPRWMIYVANAILLLLPKRTRDKFIFLSEESELCDATGLNAADLPEDLKGGIEGSRARREKALEDERTKGQLPDVYLDALANPDQAQAVAMSQAAC